MITLPFKLRPAVKTLPAQLNTSLNGGIFLGRRTDIYRLRSRTNELGLQHASLSHYGISLGIFSGIGSTAMNPWVTNPSISAEYDAVIVPYGINLLLGVNNVTFGFAVGKDHAITSDRSRWIYRNSGWIGLTVGLNLN